MKLSCNIIRDLLPLVADNLASEDTVKLVNEHMNDCKECKREYEQTKEEETKFKGKERIEVLPLKNIKRKLKSRNRYIGILTAFIVSLVILVGLDKATKPIPISFNNAIESTIYEDGKVFIKFTPEVSNYEVISYVDDYNIMAWKTNISKIFKNREAKNTVIDLNGKRDISIHYVNQNTHIDEQIYGPSYEGGRITLPRLVMNKYTVLMIYICLVFLMLSIAFRKKDRIKKITSTIMMIPISYIIAHIVIFGSGGATHHLIRDFCFVIAATILIFGIMISIRCKKNL